MISAMEDPLVEFLEVIGFRGCSKTTWGSLILPIFWAREQPEEYPFITIGSGTALQGGINIANIKRELETNELLKQDYGSFQFKDVDDPVPEPSFESEEEWQARNLLPSNDVRILARSRGHKVRGLKHRQWRPRGVVLDDPEDSDWVKTKENRDKTEQWLNSEVIPGLDKQQKKLVICINMLHMDALAARVKAKGTFKVLEFPLVNDADEWESCLWKAQYPNQKAIEDARKNAGAIAWEPEYKLKVVAEEGAVITPDEIHYYDERPKNPAAAIKSHGNDLAVSKKEGADYTAIVTGEVFYVDGKPKIYVRPNPFNEHVTFHDYMKRVREIPGELKGANLFFVEDVALPEGGDSGDGARDVARRSPEAERRQAEQVAGRRAIHQERHGAVATERMRTATGATVWLWRRGPR
jgi:hypothetical protein